MLELLMQIMPFVLIIIVIIGAVAAVYDAARYKRGMSSCFPVVPESSAIDTAKFRWYLEQEKIHYTKKEIQYRTKASMIDRRNSTHIIHSIRSRQHKRRAELFAFLAERSQSITNREASIINAYFVDKMQVDVIPEDPEEAAYEMGIEGTKPGGDNYISLPEIGVVSLRQKRIKEWF